MVARATGPRAWIRQAHRWLSIVFTLTVIANFAAMALGEPPPWLVYSPLPPLFLMLASGLYMFFQPYVARWRSAREA
ncbi:hypothetical protein H0E84_03530 [Luteimonas sp. SJ-92]|uniref:Transmembrane protein n=1 Tax=Luteimonas salinisoli TaxID=2752307 RepID=A0A853J8J8_9GAMM|nr:hypothetical protein [Luteimonas salinisoli]